MPSSTTWCKAIAPRFMRLTAKWYVRGGIFTTVMAEHRKRGWKAEPPVEYQSRVAARRRASNRMNPDLERLQPYPFERLRQLFAGIYARRPTCAHQSVDRRAEASDAAVHSGGVRQALPGIASYPLTPACRSCAKRSPHGRCGVIDSAASILRRRYCR